MIEQEVKVLAVDYPRVFAALEAAGASKKGAWLICDRYYDDAAGSLRAQGFRAKVRSYGRTRCELTIKRKLPGQRTKNRSEEHLQVSSVGVGNALLGLLGYTLQWRKEKFRISYALDNVAFDIDFYDGLPPVLEIEGPDEATIFAWIARLGLQQHKITTWGTKKLFRYYGKIIAVA